MQSADVLERIEKLGELPILPQTLLKIQKVASDDRSSAEDLAEVILKDEALTMRVLKVVNSSFYSSRRKERVRTISRAVVVMGFETVRKLALGLSVFDMMSKLSRSPHLMEIAQHSILVAAFAQRLAEASGKVPPEEALVTALIHDVGKVVLIDVSPQDYDAVREAAAGGMDVVEAERRQFGMAHPRAGRKLAAKWNLPGDIQSLIADHHDYDPLRPPRNMDAMSAVLVYADHMSRFECTRGSHEAELKILRKGSRALSIGTHAMEELYAEAKEYLVDFAESMGQELGDLKDYAGVVKAQQEGRGLDVDEPAEFSRRISDQLAMYQEIGSRLAKGSEGEDLLRFIVAGAQEVLGFERVVLLRRDGSEFRPWFAEGPGAEELSKRLDLEVTESTGALALTALKARPYHVPMARSEAYGEKAGQELLTLSETTSFATAPVLRGNEVLGVFFADMGADGPEIPATMADELASLATQASLAVSMQKI